MTETLRDELKKLLPGVTRTPEGSIQITIIHEPWGEAGSTTFTFSEIERLRRSEFNSFVEVIIHDGNDIRRFSGRLNLSSLSGREGFVRSLGRIVKGRKEFDSHLSEAIEAVSAELNAIPKSERVTEMETSSGNQSLFDPFITDKSANLLFGDGSSTKTYISIHLTLSLASGIPFVGYRPSRKTNVMFLDYEDVGSKFADRVNKVAGGMVESPSLEDMGRIRYMKARGVSLSEMAPQLKEELRKEDIGLLIIDSAAYACGAEIEKADAVIRFFNALESLETTSLIIAHVSKGSMDQVNAEKGQRYAIGSIFFNNGPRNIWNVVKQPEDDDAGSMKKICMYHRKCNDGPLHRLVPLETTFGVGSVSIRIGDEADWEGGMSLKSRILAMLNGGLMSRSQIDDRLIGENKDATKKALYRLKTEGKILQLGGEKGDYCLKV